MSLKLLLDENISPTVAVELRRAGWDAIHPREVGMKGRKDTEIIGYAKQNGRCLVTLDADFADLRHYTLGTHGGIIRFRIKFAPSTVVLAALQSLLSQIAAVPIEKGCLVVSDGKRYRIRQPREM